MRLHKRLVYSFVFAIVIFFLSLATSIIPCQTAPSIPNPHFSWTVCTLNPDVHLSVPLQINYLGMTSSLSQTYILVLGIAFILAFVVLSIALKPKKQ